MHDAGSKIDLENLSLHGVTSFQHLSEPLFCYYCVASFDGLLKRDPFLTDLVSQWFLVVR